MDIASLRRVAEAAAAEGASIIAGRFGREGAVEEPKGRTGDWVTSVDRDSEAAVRASLARATPHIPVLAEEGGGERGPRYWAVDPLDGTTNFLLGFPVVAVSVALVQDEQPSVAAVRAPLLGLSFSAARGRGAWCDGDRMRVSERPV